MKIVVITLGLLLSVVYIQADVEEKISNTKSQIHTKRYQEKKLSKRLNVLAADITLENRKLSKLKQDIRETITKIETQKHKSSNKTIELKKVEKLYNALQKRENQVNKKITNILSKEIAITMINESGDDKNSFHSFDHDSDDIIMQEILNTYQHILKEKFSSTKSRYIKLQNNRKIIKSELTKLQFNINRLRHERTKLSKLSNLQKATINNLHKKQNAYLRKLARIRKEKQTLKTMLQKLNITKREKEQTKITQTKNNNINVRQIGSSYQKTSVVTYRGAKTSAPLKSYRVLQKFGNYTDPIYKIKIFNDSVILKPNIPNSKVRNVLDGKIVYANKTPMLGYVIIIEHTHKIHTIYAHLSKIAPTIRENKRIPKGYVIGKVANTLTFEVTQNEKHINPLQMIR